MPTSGFGLYHMQHAKNNFDAIRPAPVCTETNQFIGQCQNIHVSTNCYYGYHGAKPAAEKQNEADCEMLEMPYSTMNEKEPSQRSNARKRSGDDETYPQNKRLKEAKIEIKARRLTHPAKGNMCLGHVKSQPIIPQTCQILKLQEVQTKSNNERETNENLGLDANAQELLENLYWHIHGGNIFHLIK